MQRQREFEAKEKEREEREMERQRQAEARELERQKRLLRVRTELESASVLGSRPSQSASVLGSRHLELEDNEDPDKKARMLQPVKEDDAVSLIEFSTTLLNLTSTAESLDLEIKAEVSQWWKMIIEKKLCFFCFRRHHIKFCKLKKPCGINGCKLYHHHLLHTDSAPKNAQEISRDRVQNTFRQEAAKSNGVSFNDALLSGPDLLNPLPAVLVKFRLEKFAVAGDIKEMFHQVRIRKEDVDSQRFLWRQNTNDPPDSYVMEVMTFGSTCSPSTALYVVNENAKSFSSIYPEASKSILTKEYMDDLLDSVNSEEEAKTRVKEIMEIHKSGGFQICNWLSNSKDVLSGIPEELKSNSTKQLKHDSNLPTEQVLGMWWDSESDNFVFHLNAEKLQKMESSYPTKREVLKAAMSIFDPLGLVTPTTIKGRILVQEIWRTKTTWDEVLTTGLTKKWQECRSEEPMMLQLCLEEPMAVVLGDSVEDISTLSSVEISRDETVRRINDGKQTNECAQCGCKFPCLMPLFKHN
ncbi:uncharacterized protein LOC128992856 [Macrosteles quadrilineatus]|uniref:uncharacterized protein LOC128992856 n=1 Tax=Macrosteles quadrilineatus TaxID=74068 RepID=UPI0023E0EC2C|nr:uncharacterized protein LOC128992856 [Macrosteles quadrilineatus]